MRPSAPSMSQIPARSGTTVAEAAVIWALVRLNSVDAIVPPVSFNSLRILNHSCQDA